MINKKFLNKKTIITASLVFAIHTIGATTVNAEDSDHGSSHYPGHIIGGFVGATSGSGDTAFTFGAEYELKLNEYLGIGMAVERISGEAYVGIAALHIHPVKNLRLTAGIGKEWVDSHTELDHGVPHTTPSHSETVYRIGAAYDIEIAEGYAIAPTYNLDFINGHEVSVFGLVFLKHF